MTPQTPTRKTKDAIIEAMTENSDTVYQIIEHLEDIEIILSDADEKEKRATVLCRLLAEMLKPKEELPDFFTLTESAAKKISEVENMIARVKKTVGVTYSLGGNGKGERAIKKLIQLDKQGKTVEAFWEWNTHPDQKYKRVYKKYLYTNPELLPQWVEDFEPEDNKGFDNGNDAERVTAADRELAAKIKAEREAANV